MAEEVTNLQQEFGNYYDSVSGRFTRNSWFCTSDGRRYIPLELDEYGGLLVDIGGTDRIIPFRHHLGDVLESVD